MKYIYIYYFPLYVYAVSYEGKSLFGKYRVWAFSR